ncbi:heme o synthase [Rhodoluna sp.]|uniref:heme o synthase n=1 Tax=Rhodoluna sp. TaxID=1969481 RepID=UPI0025FB22FC|nr:heme o synthase [Rhodoluna sp.]
MSPSSFKLKAAAYLALTKPRVIELLLITTVPTMILAQGGLPNLWLVLATIVGGALSAGSANAFNCIIDTDIDKIMGRTKSRPLVTGQLSQREALTLAWLIGALSVVWLGLLVNWLASAISLAAVLFYVFIYTLGLKRRTPQNIVWGGAAGAAPVLIAWAAVSNSVAPAAWVLFLIIFLWTPPHYWPLSVKYRDDYARAGVPMLPVVRSAKTVAVQIVLYTWAVVICTLLLVPIAGLGYIYAVVALVSGVWFLIGAYKLYRQSASAEIDNPMPLFHVSNIYLTLLFVALAVDPLIRF